MTIRSVCIARSTVVGKNFWHDLAIENVNNSLFSLTDSIHCTVYHNRLLELSTISCSILARSSSKHLICICLSNCPINIKFKIWRKKQKNIYQEINIHMGRNWNKKIKEEIENSGNEKGRKHRNRKGKEMEKEKIKREKKK